MEEQAREKKSVATPPIAAVPPVINLAQAVRRARSDAAAHAEVVADLRSAELSRLEALEDALQPVLAQVPKHVDLFDVGVMPGERPKLFIDMLGFVEMARDRKSYRFLQDTRHGRVTIVENENLVTIVEAVSTYIARRLVEREKALASDMTIEQAARAYAEEKGLATPRAKGAAIVGGADSVASDADDAAPRQIVVRRVAAPEWRPSAAFKSFLFVIEVLGAATFFALLGLAVWGVWQVIGGPIQNAVDKL